MIITRRRLVKLVKEEMAHPRGDLGKNIADVDFPIVVGYEGKSEIAYDKDELDNILDDIAPRGIAYSLDSLEDMEAKDVPVGASIEQMENFQLSKGSLKTMIKNSVRASVLEQVVGYQAPSGAEEDEQDDYLTTGQTSIAAKPHSQEEEQAADSSTRELTQQRQQQLDKDDTVTADDTGRQLQDLLNQKNESKMKITKRQLRRLIRESCGLDAAPTEELPEMMPAAIQPSTDAVPVPEDYNVVRDMLEQNPEIVDMGISTVMDMAGTGCERSTAQGVIDHLQDMVLSSAPAVELEPQAPVLPVSNMEMIKGPGFM
ncbi:MAG TPA: hypothetical protein EYF95_01135 [Flavobacteriales bacterium]|nr:hypothetical protein [Flavobacteriales bacterium]